MQSSTYTSTNEFFKSKMYGDPQAVVITIN